MAKLRGKPMPTSEHTPVWWTQAELPDGSLVVTCVDYLGNAYPRGNALRILREHPEVLSTAVKHIPAGKKRAKTLAIYDWRDIKRQDINREIQAAIKA